MDSRMSKYTGEETTRKSRVQRNEVLYKDITKNELNNFNIHSNTTILGENKKNEIDIDKIKKILDNKYNEPVKRKSIRLDEEEEYLDPEVEITKEYDINVILNKARNENSLSYEEERVKKIRDTQFDILKNLEINKEEKDKLSEVKPNSTENKLVDLLNTIAINEKKVDGSNAELFDLLGDLKPNADTQVVDPIEKSMVINSIEDVKNDDVKSNDNTSKMKKIKEEFYTTSTKFNKKDFEDFGINEKKGFVAEIFVVLILIAFLVGLFIFLKSMFNF